MSRTRNNVGKIDNAYEKNENGSYQCLSEDGREHYFPISLTPFRFIVICRYFVVLAEKIFDSVTYFVLILIFYVRKVMEFFLRV